MRYYISGEFGKSFRYMLQYLAKCLHTNGMFRNRRVFQWELRMCRNRFIEEWGMRAYCDNQRQLLVLRQQQDSRSSIPHTHYVARMRCTKYNITYSITHVLSLILSITSLSNILYYISVFLRFMGQFSSYNLVSGRVCSYVTFVLSALITVYTGSSRHDPFSLKGNSGRNRNKWLVSL